MQFNTAAGFLLSGVGLLAHVLGQRRVSLTCGAIVLSLGAATLSQYLFGVSFGIDQAFMKHEITVQTSHPGRMAPNTALCFLLSGATLLTSRRQLGARREFLLKRVSILGAMAMSVVALLGYISQVETAYGWTSLTRMALHTSVGFILLNAGLLATTFRREHLLKEIQSSMGWLALAGVAISMMTAVSLSFELEKNEAKSVRAELAQEALFIENSLESALGARFLDIRRIAQRMEFQNDAPADAWRMDAQDFLSAHPDLLALGYADLNFLAAWFAPINSGASNTDFEDLTTQDSLRLKARSTLQKEDGGRAPIGFVSDAGLFFAFLPIFDESDASGYSVGVFDLDVLVRDELSKEYFRKHGVSIYRKGALVFQSADPDGERAKRWGVSEKLSFFEIEWTLNVWPKPEFLRQKQTPLRFVVMGVGLLFSCLLLLMYRYGVSERRRAIEQANDAAFLDTVLNNVSDGIVACDANGRLTVFNKAARTLHDVDPALGRGECALDFFDKMYRNKEKALASECSPIVRALNGEELRNTELSIISGTHGPRTAIVNAAPLYGAGAGKIGAVVTLRDVSSERAAVEDARRSEDNLKLIFDNVPVRLWLKDSANNIVRLNKPAAESIGVAAPEVEGRNAHALFARNRRLNDAKDLDVLTSGKPVYGVIEEITLSNGKTGWASTDKVPYRDHSTGEQFVLIASTDITTLVEAREELMRSNSELEQFARVASHDLQEPLRKLMIYTRFLEEDLNGSISNKVKSDLDAILSASERMRNLVRDMLSLSKIRSGGLKAVPVDPHECIGVAMASLSERCRELGAVLIYDELPKVLAEPTMLAQVYQNIVGNALKFTEMGRTPKIHFRAKVADEFIILSIEDNGIGIAPEYRDCIFDPLTRIHNAEKYDGTGIGLAICKKIIESFGGKIWVEEGAAQGACFKFSLRRASALESAA